MLRMQRNTVLEILKNKTKNPPFFRDVLVCVCLGVSVCSSGAGVTGGCEMDFLYVPAATPK